MGVLFIFFVAAVGGLAISIGQDYITKFVRYEIIEYTRCTNSKYRPVKIVSLLGVKFISWKFNAYENEYDTIGIAKSIIERDIENSKQAEKDAYCDKNKTKRVIPYGDSE